MVVVVVHFAGGLACFTTGLEHGNEGSRSKFSSMEIRVVRRNSRSGS